VSTSDPKEQGMVQALYRKWRPQTWDETVGQDHVIQTLRNAVRGGHIAHAYLFAGPRGTGKTTTARILAKAVNCLAESAIDRPCNTCEHCLAVNEGRFLDLIEIDAASNTSVEDVRDLRDKINFAPNQGRYKVYIIDEVHMLSTAAFNALLKTLEEPPAHAIFVLATTEVHKVPATVLSRCQRHEFRRIPLSDIVQQLGRLVESEGLEIEPEALQLIGRQATGSMRDAISLLDQLTSTGECVDLAMAEEVLGTATSEAVRDLIQAAIDHDTAAGLNLIARALDGGADPRQLARQVVDYLRGLLLMKMQGGGLIEVQGDIRDRMARQSDQMPLDHVLIAVRAFSRAAAEGRATWQPSLPLELAFIETVNARPEPLPEGGARLEPRSGEASRKPPALESDDAGAAAYHASAHGVSLREQASPGPEEARTETGDPQGAGLQQVSGRWRDILAAARKYDARTQALLNSSRPLGVESGVLVLGFRSDLLREKMEKGHNADIARRALNEVLGVPLALRCVLTGSWSPSEEAGDQPAMPVEDGGMVATALRELGGHIVDVEPAASDGEISNQL
jgi:DNA polymerase-3 subunit gamma/tau